MHHRPPPSPPPVHLGQILRAARPCVCGTYGRQVNAPRGLVNVETRCTGCGLIFVAPGHLEEAPEPEPSRCSGSCSTCPDSDFNACGSASDRGAA